jgi:2-methylcitrate dehydratase PrpD
MGDTAGTAPITLRLAERWAGVRPADVPDEAAEAGRHCLLDWLGCALAGSGEPLTGILAAEVVDDGADGPCTLVGQRGRTTPRIAALVNGAAGHALDYDDTHTTMSGHPTVPVLPAALALAEHLDAGGEALLTALVVGIEVECRIGALLNPDHYRAGWHATGTLGIFGAAAAAAHLLGLDAGRFAHALALAGTQAAGLKASFGTMAKPLHAGKAATDGLLAAALASGGFTGEPAVLEAPQGLGHAAGRSTVAASRLDRHADRWLVRDTLFKYHAACYLTHPSINAARFLAAKVEPGEIAQVEVTVSPDSLSVCNIEEPTTGLEGKFSLRATTAMALLGDDTADEAVYTDARMADPDLVALRDKVRVLTEEGRPPTLSKVTVETTAGQRLGVEDDVGHPAADLAAQAQHLGAKFQALATPVIGDDRAKAVHAAALGVHELASVRDLTVLLGA